MIQDVHRNSLSRSSHLSRSARSWVVFEGTRNPYVALISAFVFMPYFATMVVGNPVRGQEIIAGFGQWAGWIVALTAPLLGTAVDRLGPRKPWLAAVVAVMVPAIAVLWWARPANGGIGIQGVVIASIIATVCFSWTEVLHNSMLANAVPPEQTHRASGYGLTAGSVVTLAVLIIVFWAFALPGKVSWPFVPLHPLLGLDPLSHEPERVVALIASGMLALGIVPLLLFAHDAQRTDVSVTSAVTQSARTLYLTLMRLREHRDVGRFLLARMLYFDGMTAILLFGGVYAAGVMGWGALQLLAFGVSLSVFSALGGLVGSALDGSVGPRRAVMIEVAAIATALVLTVGVNPGQVLYFWSIDRRAPPLWNGPFFTSWPDIVYLLLGFFTAVFINAAYASSRTLLVRLSPQGESGAFFGIYALSGTATLWLGAFTVHFATSTFGTQQAGFLGIAILIVCGLLLMTTVRGGDTTVPVAPSIDEALPSTP